MSRRNRLIQNPHPLLPAESLSLRVSARRSSREAQVQIRLRNLQVGGGRRSSHSGVLQEEATFCRTSFLQNQCSQHICFRKVGPIWIQPIPEISLTGPLHAVAVLPGFPSWGPSRRPVTAWPRHATYSTAGVKITICRTQVCMRLDLQAKVLTLCRVDGYLSPV